MPDTVYTPLVHVAETSPMYPLLQLPVHDWPLEIVSHGKAPLPTVKGPLQAAARQRHRVVQQVSVLCSLP